MRIPRFGSRLEKLEAQQRPAHVAAILARVRQCAPAGLHDGLLDALTSVDLATARAIMDQLTDAEFDALLGPELTAILDALPATELAALARGDPVVTRQVQRALCTMRHQEDVCP